MNPTQSSTNSMDTEKQLVPQTQNKPHKLLEKTEEKPLTLGQRVADAMAAKVGSWTFLTVQSSILAGWVGLNMMPGVPHWDEQPFILLNLVFSFASAYTAPIVLMSQNRQSDQEREKNEYDHHVNLLAAQNIELLHEKMDSLQAQQIQELTQIVKQQQRSLDEIKASVLHSHQAKPQYVKEIRVTDEKFPNGYSVYLPSKVEQPSEDNSKTFEAFVRRQEEA